MNKYNWDLTKIISNKNEFDSACEEINNTILKLVKYKGKILDSSNNLLEVLNLDTHLEELIEKIYVYSHLGYYSDMSDVKFQEYKEKSLSLVQEASSKTSFITPELLKSDYSIITNFIKENKGLERYKLSFSNPLGFGFVKSTGISKPSTE